MKNLLLAVVVACLAVPAWAQQQCGPRAAFVDILHGKYGETRRTAGIDAGGGLTELWANDETQTWTITRTTPDGRTCLMIDGRNFEAATEALPNTDDPA